MEPTQNQTPNEGKSAVENVDLHEILKSLNEDKVKGDYDVEKFQNLEDIKKIKRKEKKLQKEVQSVAESNIDVKDKIIEIFSRFQKLANETKAAHEKFYQFNKNYSRLAAEKENIRAEHTKFQSVNTNLESFCKGLQQQNQDLIEENKKLQNDEKELRTGLANDFQTRINTITNDLQEQAKEHLIKTKENELIKEKLKEVQEKYESREKIFSEEFTNRGQKFEDHFKEIQEKFGSIESEANKIEEYTAELEKVKGDTQGVTDKLKTLTEKSDIFQTLMTETNTFFGKTKSDMEKISLKTKKLDEENIDLQKKSERSNISIIDLVEENVKLNKEFLQTEEQKTTLANLMQTLEKTLKEETEKIEKLQGSA